MKIVEDLKPMFKIEESFNLLDMQIKTVDIRCCNCNNKMRIPEASITRYSEELIKIHIDELNDLCNDIINESIKLFGENLLQRKFINRVKKFKDNLYKPDLKCIRKDDNKENENY